MRGIVGGLLLDLDCFYIENEYLAFLPFDLEIMKVEMKYRNNKPSY